MRNTLLIRFCLVLLIISLCGCGGSHSSLSSGNTGSITARLDWSEGGSSSGIHSASVPAGVVTVRIVVSGADMGAIQKDFPASDGQGQVDGVPAGTNRTVTAQGLDANNRVTAQGSIGNVAVAAGQTTDVGTIIMVPTAPSLTLITVTPANPTVSVGATQQFAATGTYSDSTTRDITTQVTWTSSNPSVATINSSGGLATAVSAGAATITAALGSVTGSTSLAVVSGQLPIGFPINVPTGNFRIDVRVCVGATCASGSSFTIVNSDINQFAQALLDALNTAGQQLGTQGVTTSISYTPWDGTSFTITDNLTFQDGTTASITYTVTKI